MPRSLLLILAASLASACSNAPDGPWPREPKAFPPVEATYPLPAMPERSPRNASYTIEARLDEAARELKGSLVLEWRNTSSVAVARFPFHLYWNAFRNNLSTSSRGEGPRAARFAKDRSFGYTQPARVVLLGAAETDLTPTLAYPGADGNPDDRTLFEVTTPAPVLPGESARFRVEWTSRVPHGSVGRAGFVNDYFFVVQWFPKIGVLRPDGTWSAHAFHSTTEFFADFGVYDVRLTLPARYVVGATGLETETKTNADGTLTRRFQQDDVHDFAWTACPRFLVREARFDEPGYPPVAIRLLLMPEHAELADRYLDATKIALRAYGTWTAPYPYPQVTVVDPAWFSASGGMEYPTLFTGGAQVWSPPAMQSPEGVTVHEAGHQFLYGLVATDEFEEAWLDEGFNQYLEDRAMDRAYGPRQFGRRYFGGTESRGRARGIPVLAPGVFEQLGDDHREELREHGREDPMVRRAFEYLHSPSYYLNTYDKPALVMQTLENHVGADTMDRILRTWARRYRFAHPTTRDFIATVNEVTGRDWSGFFAETFYSNGLCDYATDVRQEPARAPAGFLSDDASKFVAKASPAPEPAAWDVVVTIERRGEVTLPVEIRFEFEDGRRVDETWDGREPWKRFTFQDGKKLRRAVVDPGNKLAIDVNRANNEWRDEDGLARRAASKWSARYLFWIQTLLELHTVLG
jgi:hypothetical protein